MNGIINIYKPSGMTSHAVVAKARKILNIKKAGHTGTLDPEAEGVLLICIGKGTKASDMLTNSDKQYKAVLQLGISTDTQDATGNIIKRSDINCTQEQIHKVVQSFTGEIMQTPPMYSAIKVQGKKLYELARKGIEVKRKPRKITIHRILVDSINKDEVNLTIDCSKGTYIRTLCSDIGDALSCGGIMKSLIRTKVGKFSIEDSITLEQLEKDGLKNGFTPIVDLFDNYTAVYLNKEQEKKVRNGVRIKVNLPDGIYKVLNSNGELLSISHAKAGVLVMLKTFYGG